MSFKQMENAKQAITKAMRSLGCSIDGRYISMSQKSPYCIQAGLPVAKNMQIQMQLEHDIRRIHRRQLTDPKYRGMGTWYFFFLDFLYDNTTDGVSIFGKLVKVSTAQILRMKHVDLDSRDVPTLRNGVLKVMRNMALHLKPPAR